MAELDTYIRERGSLFAEAARRAVAETAIYMIYLSLASFFLYRTLSSARRRHRFPRALAAVIYVEFILLGCLWACAIAEMERRRVLFLSIAAGPYISDADQLIIQVANAQTILSLLSEWNSNAAVVLNLLYLTDWPLIIKLGIGALSLSHIVIGIVARFMPGYTATTSWMLSIVSNAICTSIFLHTGWSLWSGRRTGLPGTSHQVYVRGLLFVAALGIVFFILGILRYQLGSTGPPESPRFMLFRAVFVQIVGLYPTAITAVLHVALDSPRLSKYNQRVRAAVGDTVPSREVGDLSPYVPGDREQPQVGPAIAPLVGKAKTLGIMEALVTGPAGGGQVAASVHSEPHWRSVRHAAQGVGITPQALLESINLVQHPNLPRERYEGTMPPRYDG